MTHSSHDRFRAHVATVKTVPKLRGAGVALREGELAMNLVESGWHGTKHPLRTLVNYVSLSND